jgi:hypothetical protein
VAAALNEDCAQFRPVEGAYSPYGVVYGFSSNLFEHMALKSTQRDAETRFGLEDVFTLGGADKLAWVNGWRQLPHVDPELAKMYAYPQKFAAQVFERVAQALHARASTAAATRGASRTGRLFVVTEDARNADSTLTAIPELPMRYIQSSDTQIVAANKAEACDQAQLLKDRIEAHFVVSYETAGGWLAITKDFLTEVLAAGRDARVAGLPSAAVEKLSLTCRRLISR